MIFYYYCCNAHGFYFTLLPLTREIINNDLYHTQRVDDEVILLNSIKHITTTTTKTMTFLVYHVVVLSSSRAKVV